MGKYGKQNWEIKARKEGQETKSQKAEWEMLRYPKKCLKCLNWLNYCQWWIKEYNCEVYQGETAKEAYINAFR